jgi:hypothetical protein
MEIAYYLLAMTSAYAFFFALSADPEGRIILYVGSPISGFQVSREMGHDPLFKLFHLGAACWALLLMLLVIHNPKYCSMNPGEFFSRETLFSCLTIAVSAKIIFGPVARVRKSIRLVGEGKFVQPISFRIYDALVMWPENLLNKFGWKIVVVSSLTGIVWVLNHFGFLFKDYFIPYPVLIAWILACFGRVSGFIVHNRVPHSAQITIYLATIVYIAVVWILIEAMMKGCGLQPGVLPS